MSVATGDPSAAAMQASAEAQMALVTGDVPLAKAKYAEAGDTLWRGNGRPREASEKHLRQFLAATQYYLGGYYQRAYGIAKEIEPKYLTPHVAGLLPRFLKDTKERSAAGYQQGIRKLLQNAYATGDAKEVISLLCEHPFVLDPAGLSIMRAISCEQLGDYRAAALFFRTARRFCPSEIELLLNTIIYPLRLPSQGCLDEAWEYVQHQVELIPHPITFATASIVCYRRAAASSGQEQKQLFGQQIRYMEQSWESYQQLSETDQAYADVRPYVSLGLVTAAHAWLELDNPATAMGLCNRAIALTPNNAAAWTLRGTITHPSHQAVADFQRAITFPEAGHIPYALLAANAWGQSDASSTLAYLRQALAQNPDPESAAKMYGWAAACRSILGAPVVEIDTLYKKALELYPGHEEVTRNYALFSKQTQGTVRQATTSKPVESIIKLIPQVSRQRTEPPFLPRNNRDSIVNGILQTA